MKHLICFLFFVAGFSAQAEFCNWGFVGPKLFNCEGETYYYGTAACESGTIHGAFCHESLNQNGPACAADRSQATMDCYRKMIKREPEPTPREYCNWGFKDAEKIMCNGKTFYYGSAYCTSGSYLRVFCSEGKKAAGGKACADDHSRDTVRCFNNTVGSRLPGQGPHMAAPKETPSNKRSKTTN